MIVRRLRLRRRVIQHQRIIARCEAGSQKPDLSLARIRNDPKFCIYRVTADVPFYQILEGTRRREIGTKDDVRARVIQNKQLLDMPDRFQYRRQRIFRMTRFVVAVGMTMAVSVPVVVLSFVLEIDRGIALSVSRKRNDRCKIRVILQLRLEVIGRFRVEPPNIHGKVLMIGVALLMPIDSRRTACVRDDSPILHLCLNGKVDDIRAVVAPLPTFSRFRAGMRSQGSDCQCCAGCENEEFLHLWSSFHNQEAVTIWVAVPLWIGSMPHRPFCMAVRDIHIASLVMVVC
jgi:hypothetical protein